MISTDEPIVFDEGFRSEPALAPPSAPPARTPAEMLVLPLVRWRRTIAALLGLGVLGGLFAAALLPNVYTSTGKVLVRLGEREQGTPDTALADDRRVAAARVVREDMQNEVHLFRNPAVLERVVDEVGASKILSRYDPAGDDRPGTPFPVRWFHRFQSWWFDGEVHANGPELPDSEDRRLAAIEELQNRVTIDGEPASSVISVSVDAHSPELARSLADTLVRALLERHQDVFAANESLDFLDSQVKNAAAAAKDADAKLDAFCETNHVFDLPAQSKNLLEEISKLEFENSGDSIRLESLKARDAFVRGLLSQPREVAATGTPEGPKPLPNLEYVRSLKEQIDKLRIELAKVRATFKEGSSFRRVQEQQINASISELENALVQDAPTEAPTSSAPVAITDVAGYERLRGDLEKIAEEQKGLEVAVEPRRQRLDSLRAELQALQKLEPEYRVLEATADQAHKQLGQYGDARNRAQSIALLDKVKMSNLRVIQEPPLPQTKTSPDRLKTIGIGAIVGLLLGVGLAFPLSFFDRRIRRPRDVERVLDLPVLHVVPEAAGLRKHARLFVRAPESELFDGSPVA
jgi:uncharacterized protein involved in exopolysaccharide biosynthesis